MDSAGKGENSKGECKRDIAITHDFRGEIPSIVDRIVSLHDQEGRFSHIGPEPVPSKASVIDVIDRALRIIYPGYFSEICVDEVNIRYYFGQELIELFQILSDQVTFAIRHDCIRFDLVCTNCEERGQRAAVAFLNEIPALQTLLAKDIVAAYEGDPASKYFDEIIFSYPGLFALTVYRIAHQLHQQGVPLIPRIMTEYAHSVTGIDIHPGVRIGESFFIDHGTGVVIGETAVIGNRVRIYQGVTLGALSLRKDEVERLRNKKRHPTIEDDVIIYANATILGGDTVIGARSIIGGNVWLTDSVPPDTNVFLKKPELVFMERSH
ncbi:MAG: Serine acetyltransferase [Syntrophorhabdus sp. PtaU1.Bin153]|nr:MAG: Serine acetyltransferase [Syntrophorhabdus sp. PtaU1.Bin153]